MQITAKCFKTFALRHLYRNEQIKKTKLKKGFFVTIQRNLVCKVTPSVLKSM